MVIAVGVRETGEREVLGSAVGVTEEAYWREFLRSFVVRRLQSEPLVVSSAHDGLNATVRTRGYMTAGGHQQARHIPEGIPAVVAEPRFAADTFTGIGSPGARAQISQHPAAPCLEALAH